MDIFEKFFHIWNLWGPMHLSINVWSWSGKKSESWYSLMLMYIDILFNTPDIKILYSILYKFIFF